MNGLKRIDDASTAVAELSKVILDRLLEIDSGNEADTNELITLAHSLSVMTNFLSREIEYLSIESEGN